mmetsp:Transcript_76582/g.197218  ORF Transcript_76582/g.197218 Transcript_76582/m.197218 type:complete len:345 (-) Transcript_76582:295-1329(-)
MIPEAAVDLRCQVQRMCLTRLVAIVLESESRFPAGLLGSQVLPAHHVRRGRVQQSNPLPTEVPRLDQDGTSLARRAQGRVGVLVGQVHAAQQGQRTGSFSPIAQLAGDGRGQLDGLGSWASPPSVLAAQALEHERLLIGVARLLGCRHGHVVLGIRAVAEYGAQRDGLGAVAAPQGSEQGEGVTRPRPSLLNHAVPLVPLGNAVRLGRHHGFQAQALVDIQRVLGAREALLERSVTVPAQCGMVVQGVCLPAFVAERAEERQGLADGAVAVPGGGHAGAGVAPNDVEASELQQRGGLLPTIADLFEELRRLARVLQRLRPVAERREAKEHRGLAILVAGFPPLR